MQITTKFSNGDTVVWIWQRPVKHWIPCALCEGSGYLQVKENRSISCPDCYGRGGKEHYTKAQWQITSNLTIGEVRSVVRGEWEGSSDRFTNYGPQEYKQETTYMARETGIGSGTVYEEENLFATQEEAQAECDRRNKEETNEPPTKETDTD